MRAQKKENVRNFPQIAKPPKSINEGKAREFSLLDAVFYAKRTNSTFGSG